MSLRLDGLNPLAYMGVTPYQPPNFVVHPRPPTQNDSANFNIGTLWLDVSTNIPPTASDIWMLVSLAGNIATWVNFAGGGSGSGGTKTTIFESTGTWNKDPRTKVVKAYGWNGGSGGGSGSTTNGVSPAYAGGTAGPMMGGFFVESPSMFFPDSLTVTVGLGGAGGAAVSTSDTIGNNGVLGGVTSFGPYVRTFADPVYNTGWGSGQPGFGRGGLNLGIPVLSLPSSGILTANGLQYNAVDTGTIDFNQNARLRGVRNINSQIVQENGGSSQIDTHPTAFWILLQSGTEGGSGGSFSGLPFTDQTNGVAGGSINSQTDDITVPNVVIPGGTAGVTSGSPSYDGGDGNDWLINANGTGLMMGGTGGGGGCAQAHGATRAGNGGNGGFPGGSGGGGGNAINGSTSGAGGAGADGFVVVIEYF